MSEKVVEYGREVAKLIDTDEGRTEAIAGEFAEELFDSDEFVFGYASDPYEGIRSAYVPQLGRQTLIVGDTGQGKTTAGFNLASQVPEDEGYLFLSETVNIEERFAGNIESATVVSVTDTESYGLGLFDKDELYDVDSKARLVLDIIRGRSDDFHGGPAVSLTKQLVKVMVYDAESHSFADLYTYLSDVNEREALFERVGDDVPPTIEEEFDEIKTETLLPIRHRVQEIASDEELNEFTTSGKKRTFSVENFEQSIEDGENLVIEVGFDSIIGDILGVLYAEAAEAQSVQRGTTRQSYLFFDGVSHTEVSRRLGIKLSKARGFNQSMVFMFQQFRPDKYNLDNQIQMNCGNVIVLPETDTQTANQCASIFEYGRNHFMNQKTYHYTAKLVNKYSESVTITGNLFPKRE